MEKSLNLTHNFDEMDKRRKILPLIGMIFISSNFLIGELAPKSNITDFIRGLLAGMGLIFILFPFIKRKKPTAASK